MAHVIKRIARAASAKVNSYTGPAGELVLDTQARELVVEDGATAGGVRIATKSQLPSVATISTSGLMSASDKVKLDGIAVGANNYSHPAYTIQTGKPIAAQTPAFGGTVVVSQVTSDSTGHVTGVTDRTITIPDTVVVTSAAGLVPAPAAGDNTKFLRGDGTWAVAESDDDDKFVPELELSKTEVSLSKGEADTVTVTTDSDGTISVSTSDATVATATISGTTVTVTAVNGGTATITVSVSSTPAYFSVRKDISVDVAGISDVLSENTFADIKSIGAAGEGDLYWDVGDTKDVAINGTVGTLAVNATYKVFIIEFNYRGDNGVYFQGFKNANGVDAALCDSGYDNSTTDGSKKFNMNHWGNYNYGGWKGCDLRYDILGSTDKAPSGYGSQVTTSRVGYDATSAALTSPKANTLMAALPSDLRSNMAAWTIYTDNKGNSSNTSAGVTSSIDYLPLLSEYEVHGTRSYANQYEQNNQTQMTYYKNGNSKIKYRHDAPSSAVDWWCRSPYYYNIAYFCFVNHNGNADNHNAKRSLGLTPAFRIA